LLKAWVFDGREVCSVGSGGRGGQQSIILITSVHSFADPSTNLSTHSSSRFT
jgi:hypothetical protein